MWIYCRSHRFQMYNCPESIARSQSQTTLADAAIKEIETWLSQMAANHFLRLGVFYWP
jgi:hypothetical protein